MNLTMPRLEYCSHANCDTVHRLYLQTKGSTRGSIAHNHLERKKNHWPVHVCLSSLITATTFCNTVFLDAIIAFDFPFVAS